MQKFNGQLINQFPSAITGNAAAGAQVAVRLKSTGALASLYAANDVGGASLPNPLTADSKGYYGFFAADGVYLVSVNISGTPQVEIQLQDVDALQSQFDNALSNAGYVTVGTFSAGCTVSQSNGVVSDGSSFWRWDGSLPKTVTAGSSPTPTGAGAWMLVSDGGLRGDLSSLSSTVDVAGQQAMAIVKTKALLAAITDNAPVGANYIISDRGGASCVVVASSDTGGTYLGTLASGRKLRLKSSSLFINEQNADSTKCNIALFGGALRRTSPAGSDQWEWVVDSEHETQGLSATVDDIDDYQFQVNYENSAGTRVKVGTTLFAPDRELAPYGIMTGASAATDFASYKMYAPCRLFVESTSSVTASPLWPTGDLSAVYGSGVLTITHPVRALNVDPPVLTCVTPSSGSQKNAAYDVTWGSTTTIITGYDYVHGLFRYTGSAMSVSDSKNFIISATVSGGLVTITHANGDGEFVPQLTAFGSSALIPFVETISATTVVVGFRDYAGTVVSAPSTGMSFYMTRNVLVPSVIDSGCRFAIDLGMCAVKNSGVGNISLNNWWVMGFNNATV